MERLMMRSSISSQRNPVLRSNGLPIAMACRFLWCMISTIRDMRGALYFGHPGNRGDAALWGEALGAKLVHMSGYQGHGSVAHPHGILITWATIMEGGFQVNISGRRFSNESLGYSEQAAAVMAEPEAIAFDIFDGRIAKIARQFEDFRQAEASGAVIEADSIEQLAARLKLPGGALLES